VLGYGPGAIIDFRAGAQGGGPVSVIAASLDSWEQTAKLSGGAKDPHVVREPRLEKVLGKTHFRLPPVDDSDGDGAFPDRFLRGFRFPTWLQCPSCKELKYASRWASEQGDPSRWCARCSKDRRVFVVPSRFVTACENGHIDEFPWLWWLATRSGQELACGGEAERKCRFKLESAGGSGLEGLRITCHAEGCGASASLGGAFSEHGLAGLPCGGRRPWITNDKEPCSAKPRTLQRGASNLYFPVTFSALSIPPWTDKIQEDLHSIWQMLLAVEEPILGQLIASAASTNASMHNMTEEQYSRVVRDRIALAKSVSPETLRPEEYSRLSGGDKTPEFQVSQETIPDSISSHIGGLARVERLREVRTLTAFKRIYQPASLDEPGRGEFGELSLVTVPWLPAIEVRGEGIFVTLQAAAIEAWLADPQVSERAARVEQAYAEQFEHQHGEASGRQAITPEYLLLHSLAHAVIKRLSFECGYDVASLRERIYVSREPWMAGFLIYTSTSDADGTLGGLERQGGGDRFEATIRSAIQDCVWCSSDPLCRSGVSSLSESLNLAACHSCLLLPETCCELGNRFLDRSMLVSDGSASEPAGFFDTLPEVQGG
jgi:hypothetical protein